MPTKSAPIEYALTQAQKIAAQLGYILVDVELVKEMTGRFLRFYIDRDGGVSLSDCEAFHRAVQPLVEKVDYDYMEVSSPGADRPLKSAIDFERAEGQTIELKFYKPINGAKMMRGELVGLQDGCIKIIGPDGAEQSIEQKQVALAKPYLEFTEEDLMDEIAGDEGEG